MLNCTFVCSFPDYVLDRTIIISKGHEHKVSGYKLAKASDYFRSQLKEIRFKELERIHQKESDKKPEKNPPQRTRTRSLNEIEYDRIKVDYNDVYGLEYILSYIHCQDDLENPILNISPKNSKPVIKAGIFFQVPSVVEFCISRIQKNINFESCWDYYKSSTEVMQDYPDFHKFVETFILENFDELTATDKYLTINIEQLKNFLKNDFLNTKQENKMITLIERWIEHDFTNRHLSFLDLLKCIRLGRLTSEELTQILSSKFITQNKEYFDELINVAKRPLSEPPVSSNIPNDIISYIHKPRLPHRAIIVVGGWEGNQDDPHFGPSKALQVYNNRANQWKRIIDDQMGLDEGHAYSGCVVYKGKIYVIGGYVALGPTQTLKMFDLSLKQWKYMSPMHEKRNYITTCLLNDFIYAIGGHNGRTRLNSVERYDPAQNHWSFVAPMQQTRSDAGCDSLMDKLYVCGGFDGHRFYASVEIYDPKVNQWTFVAPMNNIRSGVSVVTYKKFLFAIGGNDGIQRLRTVERYDPITNRWQMRPSMLRQRSNFCLAVLEDEIYVMGGWSDETNSTIALVEKWQPGLSNQWEPVEQLFMAASANCCCAVSGIDNIRELL